MDEPLFSIPQVRADLGNIGRTTLYALVGNGDLELVKLGRKSVITGRSLRRFKEKLLEQIAA